MNIQPTYVTFEQAKLLKEKGFDLPVYYCYNIDGSDKKLEEMWSQGCEGGMSLEDWLINYNLPHFNLVSKPELWQVIEWLRINHKVIIQPEFVKPGYNDWRLQIWKINGDGTYFTSYLKDNGVYYTQFNSPQEAYLAAFDYILKNLI